MEWLGVWDALLCKLFSLVTCRNPFEVSRVNISVVEVQLFILDGKDLGQGRSWILPSACYMQLESNAVSSVVGFGC